MSKLEEARRLLAGNLKSLDLGTRNNIKAGSVLALLNSFEMTEARDTRKYFKANFTVLVPLADGRGRVVGSEGYQGHVKGDTFSTCFFLGDRFQRDISPFLCAVLDISRDDAKSMTAEAIQEAALALLKADGQQGAADNQIIIEVKGIESNPVEDKKKPGTLKTYINERYVRNVKPSEIADSLTEKDVERYFGSTEAFMKLVEAEA